MQQREIVPKPYQLVPFPAGQPQRKKGVGQDRVREKEEGKNLFSGWLDIELLTLRPLQVATGITDFVRTASGERLAQAQASIKHIAADPSRVIQSPVLPGSSLKGAIRSLVEVLSPSCVRIVGGLVRSARPMHLTACTDAKNLCPACRLFGTQDYKGQVSIGDAMLPLGSLAVLGTPLLWTPARSRGRGLPPRYLDSRGKAKGSKVYEHRQTASGADPRVVVRPHVSTPTRLSLTNLSGAELGLLVAALGNHPQHSFPIKIGAGKPVGMGSVEVRIKTAVLLAGGDVVKRAGRLGKAIDRAERLDGPILTQRIAKWTQQAQEEKMLLPEQLVEVAKALDRTNLDKPAPDGMY